ncbi:MAG TPA: NAD(P)H-binding protein [Kofleriaceae bacterium]|jgi:NAD(P)H dehydrogenase (quinone)
MTDTLLVTGAAGQLGRLVLDFLLARTSPGAPKIIATTRDVAKLADYAKRGVDVRAANFDEPASLPAAFAGATRALIISTDAVGTRVAGHKAAIAALAKAGVKHIVYTSVPNPHGSLAGVADDHEQTENAIIATGLDHTILRNSLYIDLSLGAFKGAISTGKLVDAKGDSRLAWVTREDCARTAAAALASGSGKTILDVTGPDALSGDDLAKLLSDVSGKPVQHISVPPAALIDGLVGHGLPKPFAELLASFDAATVKGDYAKTAPTVQQLSGVAPTSVKAWLAANRAALA